MKNTNIKIIKATPAHIPNIVKVSDQVFGEGYFAGGGLEDKILNSKSIFDVALNDEDEFLGYCYTIIVAAQDIVPLYRIMSIPRVLKRDQPLGVIKTVAVANQYQKRGIGTRLAANALQVLNNKDVNACVTLAWESKDGVNLLGIVSGLNFEIHEKLPDFWYKDSLKKKYDCPICGAPPCRCAAVVYFKKLIEADDIQPEETPQTKKSLPLDRGQTKTYLGKVWWEYDK